MPSLLRRPSWFAPCFLCVVLALAACEETADPPKEPPKELIGPPAPFQPEPVSPTNDNLPLILLGISGTILGVLVGIGIGSRTRKDAKRQEKEKPCMDEELDCP